MISTDICSQGYCSAVPRTPARYVEQSSPSRAVMPQFSLSSPRHPARALFQFRNVAKTENRTPVRLRTGFRSCPLLLKIPKPRGPPRHKFPIVSSSHFGARDRSSKYAVLEDPPTRGSSYVLRLRDFARRSGRFCQPARHARIFQNCRRRESLSKVPQSQIRGAVDPRLHARRNPPEG